MVALSKRTGRSRLTIVLLVLVSVTVLALDSWSGDDGMFASLRNGATDVLSPVRAAGDSVLSPVGDAFSGVTGYGDLRDENEDLRARIAELEGDEARAAASDEEARRLSELLALDFVGNIPSVGARVVSTPVSNFEQTIQLDKGSDDGVDEDMPVVTGAGLVGRVVAASGSRATVRLVTDQGTSVGVRLNDVGEAGVATGEGPGRSLTMDFVDPAVDPGDEELVVTSGQVEGYFPAGLPVGRVTVAERAPGDLQLRVELEPLADLDRLDAVLVLQWQPSDS